MTTHAATLEAAGGTTAAAAAPETITAAADSMTMPTAVNSSSTVVVGMQEVDSGREWPQEDSWDTCSGTEGTTDLHKIIL